MGARSELARSDDPELVTSSIAAYGETTGQTSGLIRTLGLSTLGIVWVLAGGLNSNRTQPQDILSMLKHEQGLWIAFCLAAGAILFDVLHYATQALMWGLFSWAVAHWEAGPERTGPRSWAAYSIARGSGFLAETEWQLEWDKQEGAVRRTRVHELLTDPERADERAEIFARPYVPGIIVLPSTICYWSKVLLLTAAWVALLCYLF